MRHVQQLFHTPTIHKVRGYMHLYLLHAPGFQNFLVHPGSISQGYNEDGDG